MKVAIFYDFIGAVGGGERVALALARGLGGDLITTDVDPDSVKRLGFDDVTIISLGNDDPRPPSQPALRTRLFS